MRSFLNHLFSMTGILPSVMEKIDKRNLTISRILDMRASEIGNLIYHQKQGPIILDAARNFPKINISANVKPITYTVLSVIIKLEGDFRWNDRVSGKVSEPFWLWIEDDVNNHIYHYEYVQITKKSVYNNEPLTVTFTVPIKEPKPSNYIIHLVSDRWLSLEEKLAIPFMHVPLPQQVKSHTKLLDIQPLPVTAIQDERFIKMFKFTHFNPIWKCFEKLAKDIESYKNQLRSLFFHF